MVPFLSRQIDQMKRYIDNATALLSVWRDL
jgi:hypothetical protein